MYGHAAILGLLFIIFAILNQGRSSPIPLDPEYLSIIRLALLFAVPVYAAVPCFFIYITFWRAEDEIAMAKAKSEELLLNILPEPIADRLKNSKEPIADYFDNATILFADIVNFTKLSETMSPAKLVDLLDKVFAEFDAVADRLGLAKIKTIGDAYMVAGGIPESRPDHTEAVADMALAVMNIMQKDKRFDNLNLRIGIHSGPIVAGVIGRRKFIYDLWGDSVNTASRMESHGVEGRIQVTEDVYVKLNGNYMFEDRGIVTIKGKGDMQTYFLTGRRSISQ